MKHTDLIFIIVSLALSVTAWAQPRVDPTPKVLAPSGALRIAFLSGPLYATKDASGELKGVAIDLGQGISQRLGAALQPIAYANPGALMAGAKAGEFDIALMGVNAERAAVFDFSPPYMEVEQGYLARAGLDLRHSSEVDQRGMRVGVVENTGADAFLSRTLRNATLVRVKTLQELEPLVTSGGADAIAATKTFLHGRLGHLPGARVLEGRLLVEPIAIAVPRGKEDSALSTMTQFVEDAKKSGLIARAIERSGLKGVGVPP